MVTAYKNNIKELFRIGLVLTRADMAYWIIRCSEEWLSPIYHKIHEQLMTCEVLHMDETRIQCNKEENRNTNLYTTSSFEALTRLLNKYMVLCT